MKISLVQILLIYLAIMTWTAAFAEPYLAMEPSTATLSQYKDFIVIGGRDYLSCYDSENYPKVPAGVHSASQRILIRATNQNNNLVFFECGSKVNFLSHTNKLQNCEPFGKSSGYSSEKIVIQLGRQQFVEPALVDSAFLNANEATSGVRSGSITYFDGDAMKTLNSKTIVLDAPISQTRDDLRDFLSGLGE